MRNRWFGVYFKWLWFQSLSLSLSLSGNIISGGALDL